MARILIPFLIAAFICSAQTTKDLLRWMDAAAQRHLDARETAIARITNTADAAQRQAYVRSKVLELLRLPENRGPAECWLTEFEDHWPYRVAPADVYFSSSLDQNTVKRPPIIEYVSAPWPTDVMVYAIACVVIVPPLFRRIRRGPKEKE